ncbi:MAG: diaminopimelate epimerase [Alphaproteobacteria bacterium]|nr:diaminopimelate epimerase [Alphaproteobacteria bacterium]
MHGLGNDFVIIDGRADGFVPDRNFCLAVADRRRGIGCDQLIILEKPKNPAATLFMRIYNRDASEAGACGNATRCVGRLLFDETGRNKVVIETVSGLLTVFEDGPGMIAVDYGPPKLEWSDIPLAKKMDTLHVPLSLGPLSDACCVSMGNPHAVFFVEDADKILLPEIGPKLETDPLFPERANIEVAQILAPDRIRMRVWERGAGVTEACGSGACATLVAAARRKFSARRAAIVMDGGDSIVEWREDNHVLLIGPTALAFRGTLDDGLFAGMRRAS